MKKQQITFAFILAYLWMLMILFGAIVFETFIVYPDVFHDIPRSFQVGMEFMDLRGPHDFFPPVGMASMFLGAIALLMSWRVKSARYWILSSLMIIFVGEFLLSAAFFWPRNTIMFVEGTAVHSVASLKQTAQEFQTGHWVRLVLSAVTAGLAFKALFTFYRHTSLGVLHATLADVGGSSPAPVYTTPDKDVR
jgi:hypothetical protein